MTARTCTLILALAMLAAGCGLSPNVPGAIATSNDGLTADAASGLSVLPWSGGQGAQAPWGGRDASHWRPEAVIANAAGEMLNVAWRLPGTTDAIVAVPTRLFASTERPYGDGQLNAVPAFGDWTSPRPPVVATLVHARGAAPRVLFRFDRALPKANASYDLWYRAGGHERQVTLGARRCAAGDWSASWNVPDELGWSSSTARQVVLVRPTGWGDWFPIWFHHPVRPVDALYATVPAKYQHFADGVAPIDHEHVGVQGRRKLACIEFAEGTALAPEGVRALESAESTPFQNLLKHDFGMRYNQAPFEIPNIHASIPYGGREVATATGRGWTWVANSDLAPFKVLYTSFERRRPDREAASPDGGVPSGGGWHLIGDPAETILNDLEAGPIFVGHGTNEPFSGNLPSGGYAYGLADVATMRWLRPGEAFTTRRGPDGHANYHWFAFHQATEVTTEEWVHPRVPNDDYDF